MHSLKSRLFIPFGFSLALMVLALGVLQGAVPQIVTGLAVLAGLSAWTLAGLRSRPPLSLLRSAVGRRRSFRRRSYKMLTNLGGNMRRSLTQRVHIVIAGRTLVLRPSHRWVAMVVVLIAGLFIGSWWWLARPARQAEAFKAVANIPWITWKIHEHITREALRSLGVDNDHILYVEDANFETDAPVVGLEALDFVHLDNSSFTSGRGWIQSNLDKAVTYAASCDTMDDAWNRNQKAAKMHYAGPDQEPLGCL